jgi:uncharacterized protein (DUF305 family)
MKASTSLFMMLCAAGLSVGTAVGGALAQTKPAPAPAPVPAAPAMDHSKMDHSKMDHSKMGHAAPAATDTASTKAFKAANDRMHTDMAIPFSGNADVDFVKGMLPHHQGAVDMAKIVLEHGKDPAVRKLAREIIKAQDKEIAFMKAWVAKQPKAK